MTKNIFLTFLLSMLLTSCITVSVQTATPPSAPHFVTSTLPPTKDATPRPTRTPLPAPATGTAVLTKSVKCKDSAVLLEDVTIPDNSKVPAGKIFTKTWKFKNTGTCPWTGFTIHYVTGERMNAPESAPVPETATGETVDISLDLTAPVSDGAYATYFSLHNAADESIAIGAEKTFYVKVIIGTGDASVPTKSSSTSPGTTVVSIGNININCKYSYSENAGYVQELASLINQARRNAGLPALSLNPLLTQAAQGHSIDMACNNFLSHEGSDGSNIMDRISKVSGFMEIISIGTPQNAMDQWAADAPHWDVVLNAGITEMGIGYAYNANSDYGGYFTVDMGR